MRWMNIKTICKETENFWSYYSSTHVERLRKTIKPLSGWMLVGTGTGYLPNTCTNPELNCQTNLFNNLISHNYYFQLHSYIAWGSRMNVDDDLERMWKEVLMDFFKVLFHYSPRKSKESHKYLSLLPVSQLKFKSKCLHYETGILPTWQ